MELQLTNIVNISVAQTPAGIGKFNTSNLAIVTRDEAGDGFGSAGYKIYLDPAEVITDFGSASVTAKMALAAFSQQPNFLAGDGYLVVIPFVDEDETLDEAIVRTKDLVQYFGILCAEVLDADDTTAAATLVQTLNKIWYVPSKTAADIDPGGLLDDLRSGGFSKSRGLYYGGTTDLEALQFAAAYAGLGLSVNFSGSNTTITMHLKSLATIQPDPAMTQTLLGKAQAAGADVYASFQGVAKVFTSGANRYYDQVYNQEWFVGALQVAIFNVLAQTPTKIPQTEEGMSVLKGAARSVCEQAVPNTGNQYIAPGRWTSPTTFGNQPDFLRNISERGYYIYSAPVATQPQVDREARKAPLMQVALKEAGADHSSNVIIYLNA